MLETNINPEIHIFIIWEKARNIEDVILEDIKERFTLLDTYVVRWSKKQFSANLTRFYGQNLTSSSDKIRTCGDGDFRLIIVRDEKPLYRYRSTTKGVQLVNVNLFDAKEQYRNWSGGGHRIHATNSIAEVNHDLYLLTGFNSRDYGNLCKERHDVNEIVEKQLIGAEGYKDINELLCLLNNCTNYVILRNFSGIPDKVLLGEHSDLDILTDDFEQARIALGAVKDNKEKERVRVRIKVGNELLYIDIRNIGDGYYDEQWEKHILDTKVLNKELFYIPSKADYLYSLLYHAVIHKTTISEDYKSEFCRLVDDNFSFDRKDILNYLTQFMDSRCYEYTEPMDLSVTFNTNGLENFDSSKRKLRIKFQSAINLLKHPKEITKNLIKKTFR